MPTVKPLGLEATVIPRVWGGCNSGLSFIGALGQQKIGGPLPGEGKFPLRPPGGCS